MKMTKTKKEKCSNCGTELLITVIKGNLGFCSIDCLREYLSV